MDYVSILGYSKYYCLILSLSIIFIIIILFIYYSKTILLNLYMFFEYDKDSIESMEDLRKEIKNIRHFYSGYPTKGYYKEYLKKIENRILSIISSFPITNIREKAIIFDFDDTLCYTRPYNPVCPKIKRKRNKFYQYYKPIKEMLSVIKQAKELGYYIIVLTSRSPSMANDTLLNCEDFGFKPDLIFTSCYWGQSSVFKNKMRKNIDNIDMKKLRKMTSVDLYNHDISLNLLKVNVVMSIGDKWYDIDNHEDTIGIKLPDPYDMNGYILFNNYKSIIY